MKKREPQTREQQLLNDFIVAMGEIPSDERFGSFEDQRMQYICSTVCNAVSSALDDIYKAGICESPIESMMYLRLKDLQKGNLFTSSIPGLMFKTQQQLGPYRVDFLVEVNDLKIVIECDGHDFHERTKEQAEHDKKRDRFFTSNGLKVLRYTGSELYGGRVTVGEDIYMLLHPEYAEV